MFDERNVFINQAKSNITLLKQGQLTTL